MVDLIKTGKRKTEEVADANPALGNPEPARIHEYEPTNQYNHSIQNAPYDSDSFDFTTLEDKARKLRPVDVKWATNNSQSITDECYGSVDLPNRKVAPKLAFRSREGYLFR